jgi:hypothetical protein
MGWGFEAQPHHGRRGNGITWIDNPSAPQFRFQGYIRVDFVIFRFGTRGGVRRPEATWKVLHDPKTAPKRSKMTDPKMTPKLTPK